MRARQIVDYIVLAGLIGGGVFLIQYFGFSSRMDGPVVVIDGDSLRLNGDEIRLSGIDAPELEQSCRLANGKSYRCGRKARAYMKKIIAGRDIVCNSYDVDQYDRDLSVCKIGETNLNLAMIRAGWAVSYGNFSLNYARAERHARQAKKGLWQGYFIEPHQWRIDNK